jgi:hypothetical protein
MRARSPPRGESARCRWPGGSEPTRRPNTPIARGVRRHVGADPPRRRAVPRPAPHRSRGAAGRGDRDRARRRFGDLARCDERPPRAPGGHGPLPLLSRGDADAGRPVLVPAASAQPLWPAADRLRHHGVGHVVAVVSDWPLAFDLGVLAEGPMLFLTVYLFIAFPSGHLETRLDRLLMGGWAVVLCGFFLPWALGSPVIAGGGPLIPADLHHVPLLEADPPARRRHARHDGAVRGRGARPAPRTGRPGRARGGIPGLSVAH